MKYPFLAFCAFFASLQAATAPESASLLQSSAPTQIITHNRVLAKINGKYLSLVDVTKRMDMIFYQEYPHLSSSLQARHQFYNMHWKEILNDMIDNELIVADAKEKKLVVSDGDVREEMEELFGPNVVLTIDNFGLTFQEVWEIISTDITVKRMIYAMVNSKALNRIHPCDIRQAYEEWSKENLKSDTWNYQVISINADEDAGQALAERVHELLQQGICFDGIKELLQDEGQLSALHLSEPYSRDDKSLSDAHRLILQSLLPGSYSEPVAQQSRNLQNTVYRIFHLQSHVKGGIVPFREVEESIKNRLVQKALNEESQLYRQQLRKRFRIDESYIIQMLPSGFQPFSLI